MAARERSSCERTSSSENRLTPDAFADATHVRAHSVNAFLVLLRVLAARLERYERQWSQLDPLACIAVFTLAGLRTQASLENYQRAERFLPGTGGIRFTSRVTPHWIEKTNRFWYRRPSSRSKKTGNLGVTPAVDGAAQVINAG